MRKNLNAVRLAEEAQPAEKLETDISIHIFSTSATMVGVCLTVIGLFKFILQLKIVGTLGDDLLAIDAMLFLASCMLSYWALRTRGVKRKHRVEKIADILFLVALSFMTIICGLITYAFV